MEDEEEQIISMEELLEAQIAVEDEIDRHIKNFTKANKQQKSSPGSLKRRIENIEGEWQVFKANHKEIRESYSAEKHKNLPYFKNDTLSSVEEKVIDATGAISDLIDELQRASAKTSTKATEKPSPVLMEVKLPQINLPRFTGDYTTWGSFRDLFNSLIHENKALPPVQKLHYLKASLGGEAEKLLRHLQVTEANYMPAWDLLIKRYNNKRALLNSHLKILFSLQQHSTETANALKLLLDTTRDSLESIKGLGIDTANWDSLILFNITQKLSTDTLSHWELTLNERDEPDKTPTLQEFFAFVETRFRTLEAVSMVKSKQIGKDKASFGIQSKRQAPPKGSSTSSNTVICPLCNQGHPLKDCTRFLELNLSDRRAMVQRFSHCYNCLQKGHGVTKCRSKFTCRGCSGKHHTLLHQYSGSLASTTSNHASGSRQLDVIVPEKSVNTISFEGEDRVLLATALISARNGRGHQIILRALIDQGSESNFISQNAARLLNLATNNTNVHVKGIGSTQILTVTKSVEFSIHSCVQPEMQFSIEAYILPKLTSVLPNDRIQHRTWDHIEGLPLADPHYYKPGRVDAILGAGVYSLILEDGIRKGPRGTPIAQLTTLGWILSGDVNPSKRALSKVKYTRNLHCKIDIDCLLKRFWEIEEPWLPKGLTEDEAKCESIYEKTTERLDDGRYSVKLPFNTANMTPDLGESRHIALKQLLQTERRLHCNPTLFEQYQEFMRDYLSQGHMELIQNKPINNRQPNYLPHHFVTKESSTTTKLRVVFDASRKTSNRKSLNDNLYVGPVVQEDLFDIITRWRIHKVAFTADIKQMYRQILVQKDDVDYQRILWRNNTDEPVADYRLLTVTYGTASAPYLATRTLQQLARDESDEFSKAANILSHDFYVDDVLSGDDSISEVLQLQTDLRILLRKGCFQLRKWISNKEDVLESLPSEEKELNVPFDITRTITIKALGILWDPIKDIFVYKVNQIHYEPPVTKRSLLSAVSKIFDPLGWLSPVIISAKILLQSLWLYKLNWDDELPHHLELQWKQYCSKLPGIEELKIPRWISYTRSCKSFELHVFCDASLHAHGACVYARVVSETNSIQTSLMAAKTRVSPVKQLTLPRLELCAALLGTQLIKNVAQSLKIDSTQLYAWSDSKIVISWITGHSKQWKQFVSNRVTEIQETLHENKWGHVPSKENPADCSSRGLNPDELRSHHLWWSGPHWLSRERTYWPSYVPDEDFPPSVLEQEAKRCSCNVAIPSEPSFMERSSSYSKLIRICAYIRRFITNAKLKAEERSIGPLTASEIHGAEKSLIRLAQKQDFNAEIIAIN